MSNGDLGEQAISKIAEAGITSQLDDVENVDVDVRANPVQVMQGNVDSVQIDGQGMTMQKDLRMEEMHLKTGQVSVNPMSAMFGKIELERPTDATVQAVLTEEDINRAFNSKFIREKLQDLEVSVNGTPTTISAEYIEFQLPGEGKVYLKADVRTQSDNQRQQVAFTAVPRVSANQQQITLEDVAYTDGEEISPELTQALLEQASELLDLRNFELEGMSLRVKQLQVERGKLKLLGEAEVREFPSN